MFEYHSSSRCLFLLLFLSVGLASSSVDEFMSCDRYFENKRVARVLDHIPCDMTKQSYCQYKGVAYPESSIWRFKEENRALMKRLYGDMESNSVYREMRASNLHNLPSEEHSIFSSLEYNIRMGSGLATVKSAREPVMQPETYTQGGFVNKRMVVKKKRKNASSGASTTTSTTTSTQTPEEQVTHAEKTTENALYYGATESPAYIEPSSESSSTSILTQETSSMDIADILSDVNLEALEQHVDELLASAQEQQQQNTEQTTQDKGVQAQGELPDYTMDQGDMEYEEYEYEYDDLEYAGPSVNACPVKEEVFAPYWANNTRDQVLALLNLYPFEQYIHMETCKFEGEEMMCRPGCRCEQQYRLHRLLAFDPNNECRGIFSDWFRFPSYCICKCYNFPENYLKERRRPRITKKKASNNADETETPTEGTRQTKDQKFQQKQEYQNIPAYLPYEAKQALLRDMRQERTLEEHKEEKDDNELRKDHPQPQKTPEDNSADHFLYGNVPVVEYQLSDGSGGSVKKTPRK